MISFLDEFGAETFIFVQNIKYFKENVGGVYVKQHSKAKSVIETMQGDLFYSLNTVQEIKERLIAAITGGKVDD